MYAACMRPNNAYCVAHSVRKIAADTTTTTTRLSSRVNGDGVTHRRRALSALRHDYLPRTRTSGGHALGSSQQRLGVGRKRLRCTNANVSPKSATAPTHLRREVGGDERDEAEIAGGAQTQQQRCHASAQSGDGEARGNATSLPYVLTSLVSSTATSSTKRQSDNSCAQGVVLRRREHEQRRGEPAAARAPRRRSSRRAPGARGGAAGSAACARRWRTPPTCRAASSTQCDGRRCAARAASTDASAVGAAVSRWRSTPRQRTSTNSVIMASRLSAGDERRSAKRRRRRSTHRDRRPLRASAE